jgi:hypothetical protein
MIDYARQAEIHVSLKNGLQALRAAFPSIRVRSLPGARL